MENNYKNYLIYNTRNILNYCAPWIISFCIAFVVINCAFLLYEKSGGWIYLNNNQPTESVWRPGAIIVHSLEGRGIYRADENGYLNDSIELADEYILAVGASHTAGKEIKHGERYSDLLNNLYSDETGKVHVYNVSQDGFYLKSIIKYFDNLIVTFPDSKAIIYEIGAVSISEADAKELSTLFEDRLYESGNVKKAKGKIDVNYSTKDSVKFAVKEWVPLINIIKRQFLTFQSAHDTNGDETINEEPGDISKFISHMRNMYKGDIIFVYHPRTIVTDDGMEIYEDSYLDTMKDICADNGIYFIDMSDVFTNNYEQNHIVPYGFMNTALGDGHLNKYGHKMIADEVYKLLEEIE